MDMDLGTAMQSLDFMNLWYRDKGIVALSLGHHDVRIGAWNSQVQRERYHSTRFVHRDVSGPVWGSVAEDSQALRCGEDGMVTSIKTTQESCFVLSYFVISYFGHCLAFVIYLGVLSNICILQRNIYIRQKWRFLRQCLRGENQVQFSRSS